MNKALGVHSATAWQTNNVTAQVVPQKAACGRARDRKANFSSANSPTDRLSEGLPVLHRGVPGQLHGKRKYNQAAWRRRSTGQRKPECRESCHVIIQACYPAMSSSVF